MAANSNTQFINLNALQGSGEVGLFKSEVVGVLVGIEPRDGFYQVADRKTGQLVSRPNSWTAHFEDGSKWAWPTYVDENTGQVKPWSRFDQSINLAACVANRVVIHVWKDDRNFSHLEIADEQFAGNNLQPLPVMTAPLPQQAAMPAQPMPSRAPWMA